MGRVWWEWDGAERTWMGRIYNSEDCAREAERAVGAAGAILDQEGGVVGRATIAK